MIKLFEEYNSYYKEINIDEFMDGPILAFTTSEIKYITNKCGWIEYDEYDGKGDWLEYDKFQDILFYTVENNEFYLYKQADEWFLLKYSYEGKSHYYKCDQLDGLIKCINDKLLTF